MAASDPSDAESLPARLLWRKHLALLVYLAAVIPEPGRSVRDQFTADPSMFNPEWIQAGARWFDKSQTDALAREFLFHDCDEATLAWALPTVAITDTRHVVTQPCPLDRLPEIASASIVATGDRTLSADWCRRVSRRLQRSELFEVDTGHCPHVSQPEELTRILEQLANRHTG